MINVCFQKPINDMQPYMDDIQRIIKIAQDTGYNISQTDAYLAWSEYSAGEAVTWFRLDDYDDYSAWLLIVKYFKIA